MYDPLKLREKLAVFWQEDPLKLGTLTVIATNDQDAVFLGDRDLRAGFRGALFILSLGKPLRISDQAVRIKLSDPPRSHEELALTDVAHPPAGASPGAELRQNDLIVTAGLRFGRRDFFGTATGSYLRLDDHQFGSDSAFRQSISVEKRTSKNHWLTLTLSKDEGHANGGTPSSCSAA